MVIQKYPKSIRKIMHPMPLPKIYVHPWFSPGVAYSDKRVFFTVYSDVIELVLNGRSCLQSTLHPCYAPIPIPHFLPFFHIYLIDFASYHQAVFWHFNTI